MIDQIVVLDTETTGTEPAEGAALLELACVPVQRWQHPTSLDYGWRVADGAWWSDYVRYEGVIPPEARGVHHIGPESVGPDSGAMTKSELLHGVLAAETPELCYAAHNAAFDSKFLPELKTPWICTWRCAMHLWPEVSNHKNMTLRYALGAEPPAAALEGLSPHRALYDAACTAAVLCRMLETHTAEELLRLTVTPVLQTTVRFGVHRGKTWRDVPKDYLRWMMTKSDLCREDADLRHTVRHHLGLPAELI